MFSASAIDPSTIHSYVETEYRVFGVSPFILKVGQVSLELSAAHKLREVNCSAFLTACNPLSQEFDDLANASRQAEFAHELKAQGLTFERGIGIHPSNNWPGEDSFLVFGLSLEDAKRNAARLEQNAFIWNGADAVPQLILMR